MGRAVHRKSFRYVCPSKLTKLQVFVGQVVKVHGEKYTVESEIRESDLQMGCWGCAFNRAVKREEFEIPSCCCLLKNDFTPVAVFLKNKERELIFTCNDLYCACTGNQSIVYKRKL